MSSDINIFLEAGNGECDGFNANFLQEPNLRNFLEENYSPDIVDEIILFLTNDCKAERGLVTVMTHLHVDHDMRGKGIGSELVGKFLELAESSTIILVADEVQEQKTGFDLGEFYKGFGFEQTKFYSKGVGGLFVLY